MFITMQYYGSQSDKLKTELLSLLRKTLPTIKFNIVLTNKRTIGSLFKYEDSLPRMSRSRVVYKYVCSQCDAAYVGSTIRTLYVRAAEHRGVSSRTGLPVAKPPQSAIRNHCEQSCQCAPNLSSFSIIDSETNPLYLRIKESIHIHQLKPSLNETNSAYPLYILN